MKRLNDAFNIIPFIEIYDKEGDCLKFYYKKEDGEGYDIICQDGQWSCNCQDFYHRNNYQNTHLCKHILGAIMKVYQMKSNVTVLEVLDENTLKVEDGLGEVKDVKTPKVV